MACTLNYTIASLEIDCSPQTGGLRFIKYRPHGSLASVEFKEILFNTDDKTSNYGEVLTNNDNGTTVVEQTLTVYVAGINATTRNTLNELCNPNVKLEVQIGLADGSVITQGNKFGTILSEVRLSTGASAGDAQGYTITFKGEEPSHGETVKTNPA